MKKLKTACMIITLLGVTLIAVLLVFAPDRIAAHYAPDGSVDRYGSKYEALSFAALTLAASGLFSLAAERKGRAGDESSARALMITGIAVSLITSGMGAIFLLSSGAGGEVDFVKFSGIAIGALMAVLGNIMPKVRRNSLFGLRTSWSMANDEVWARTQRFGGYVSVVCGIVMMLSSAVLTGIAWLAVFSAEFMIWLIVCLVGSYRIAKRD